MPPSTALSNILDRRYLTRFVNKIRPPASFLREFLFPVSNDVAVPTSFIEHNEISHGRETSPFVKLNGEAVLFGGLGGVARITQLPNIRLKRPYTGADILQHIGVGNNGSFFYNSAAEVSGEAFRKIAFEMEAMRNSIANTEEWLVSQAITGTITYSGDLESFTCTFDKPNANTYTLGTLWNDATPPDAVADLRAALKLFATQSGRFSCTDVIMGSNAAEDFLANPSVQAKLETANYNVGALTLNERIVDAGVIFLGRMLGVNIWEYPTKLSHQGSDVDLIRPNYIELVSRSAIQFNRMYYAAVPDIYAEALGSGRRASAPSKIYSKSWRTDDPASVTFLVASRPLPVVAYPEAHVSVEVTS